MSRSLSVSEKQPYVKVQKKITKPLMVKMINDLAEEWAVTPAEVCCSIMLRQIPKEHKLAFSNSLTV